MINKLFWIAGSHSRFGDGAKQFTCSMDSWRSWHETTRGHERHIPKIHEGCPRVRNWKSRVSGPINVFLILITSYLFCNKLNKSSIKSHLHSDQEICQNRYGFSNVLTCLVRTGHYFMEPTLRAFYELLKQCWNKVVFKAVQISAVRSSPLPDLWVPSTSTKNNCSWLSRCCRCHHLSNKLEFHMSCSESDDRAYKLDVHMERCVMVQGWDWGLKRSNSGGAPKPWYELAMCTMGGYCSWTQMYEVHTAFWCESFLITLKDSSV